jgi:hypothetical protein
MRIFTAWMSFGTFIVGFGFLFYGLSAIPIIWLKFISSGIVLLFVSFVLTLAFNSMPKEG